ncbi:sister chromatid cohesion protein PDS5 homolog C isoform X2 [Daucus carota subsp. sativus]|uniref:sister chromatid cohesion protein PDS5 homolog C isoform X2 n=1 Tax=Daucus carota subsp. sativus TaxID=79200 RepID=UPI003083B3F3
MDYSEKELEEKLRVAGERLAQLPTRVDVLLPLLDEVEDLLAKVEQSPSQSIQNAYSQSMKALLAEQLLRHANVDVQVAVASCISEITRITAPEAPYTDDQMKEVFQLIVSSFVDLSDMSSRSYNKRASILETVAKVRSCVVMLDLECEELITEMFQHFLSSIRDEHPEKILTSMETIMTLVLEESEDVSLELLTPILESLKRNDEEIPTAARKLGERVFEKCAAKLKPYIRKAVKSLGFSLDSYSEIVATVCNGSNGEVDHKDGNVSSLEHLAGETNLNTSFVEAAQDAEEPVTEEPCMEDVPLEVQKSLKSLSNEMTETGDEEMSNASDPLKKTDEGNISNKSLDVDTSRVDTDDIDTTKAGKVDLKQVKTAKRRGRKPRNTKPSNSSPIESDKEAEVTCQKVSDKGSEELPDVAKDVPTPVEKNALVDAEAAGEKEQVPFSSKEISENEGNVSPVSPNRSVLDESPKKAGLSSKEENLAQEDTLMKSAPGMSGKEISPESHSDKKKLNSALEDSPSVDSAHTEAADIDNGQEVELPNRSEKMPECLAEEHELSKDPCSATVVAADGGSDPDIKPQKLSRNKKGGKGDEPSEVLDSTKVSAGSTDSENKVHNQSGNKLENLAEEDEPLESLSPKVDDKISESEEKPQKRSGKKAARTKKTTRISKRKMPGRKGTSKIETEDSSDDEAEQQKQSVEEDSSESETKPLVSAGKESTRRHRGKNSGKGDSSEAKVPIKKQDTVKESEPETDSDGSDLKVKPVVQSGKGKRSRHRGRPLRSLAKGGVAGSKMSSEKADTTNKDEDSSKKNSERRAQVKNTKERVLLNPQANKEDEDINISPRSTSKLVKDDDQSEDAKGNAKRKRTPAREKVPGDIEYGMNLVGAKIKVWWPDDKQYYEGIIESFDRAKKKHKVSYTDGDEEVLHLQKERWELVDDDTMQEDANEDSSPDSSTKSRSRKKAKANAVQSLKLKQKDVSPRRGGAAASSKSKGAASKSGGKVDSKLKDKKSKVTGKSEDNSESEDLSVDDVPGAARKSKDDDANMPRIKQKSKIESPRTVTKAKAKSPQTGNTLNGTGKGKSGLLKVKDSGKTPEVKSTDTSKSKKSSGKSGKKRRRGY